MSKPPSLAVERPRRHGNRALQPSDHDDMATSQLQLSPYCIGCCSIIIPQTDGMMPYCQECIQSNEDIAADYHRLLDGQPMSGPFEVRVVLELLRTGE
jgi:hypothetical protein